MTAPALDKALNHYQQTLQAWREANSPSETEGLALLQARDSLHRALEQFPLDSSPTLLTLRNLDQTLVQQATALDAKLQFEQYRKSLSPQPEQWWWFLDQVKPPHPLDRFDWFFNGISLGAWTISLAFLVDISRRFLLGGSGVGGLSVVTLSSLLTLLKARSDITEAGQKGFRILLEKLRVKSYLQAEATCFTTALLTIFLGVLWCNLPHISRYYNAQGQQAQHTGELGKAEQLYHQAISLDVDNGDAHYNLGTLYEDLQDTEKATAQYLIAIQADIPDAYNSLARLHLQAATRSQDVATQTTKQHQAIALLSQGLQLAESQDSVLSIKYSFYKNLGWARLLQKQPQTAQPLLEIAIDLSEQSPANSVTNQGSAHCLLAQSLDAQGSSKALQALQSWQRCCQLGTSADANEDAWILQAQTKLKAKNYDPNALCKPNASPVS